MVLLDLNDNTQMVAIGTICELSNVDIFCGALIDEYYYFIVIKEVVDGNVCLFVENKINDLVEEHISDVLSTTTH